LEYAPKSFLHITSHLTSSYNQVIAISFKPNVLVKQLSEAVTLDNAAWP